MYGRGRIVPVHGRPGARRPGHRVDLSSMLSSMEHNLDLNERRPCKAESRVGVLHVVLAVMLAVVIL